LVIRLLNLINYQKAAQISGSASFVNATVISIEILSQKVSNTQVPIQTYKINSEVLYYLSAAIHPSMKRRGERGRRRKGDKMTW
jgi:hypothetical protein